ncbi:type IV pilin [Halobacteriaceae archaeon GCM10025711]
MMRTTSSADERAVSPVIGVILMVAITVILAAVIGTFVLGISNKVAEAPPQTDISLNEAQANSDLLVLEHGGGDDVLPSETTIKIAYDDSVYTVPSANATDSGVFSAGDRLFINTSAGYLNGLDGSNEVYDGTANFDFNEGDTVTVIVVDEPSGQIISRRSARAT